MMPIHKLGLPDNGDLIMGGPFGEPYDKYLRRQDVVYSNVSMVL